MVISYGIQLLTCFQPKASFFGRAWNDRGLRIALLAEPCSEGGQAVHGERGKGRSAAFGSPQTKERIFPGHGGTPDSGPAFASLLPDQRAHCPPALLPLKKTAFLSGCQENILDHSVLDSCFSQ
jgi:hypothetical protein